MTPDAADLTLQRWGLRFVVPAEEAGYRRWRIDQVRPVMRTGVFTALAAWGVALAAVYLAAPQGLATAAHWILGLMCPLVIAHLAMTYVRRLGHLLTPMTVVSTTTAGFLSLILVFELIHDPVIAMGAATITVFTGFTIFRLSPLPGFLCNAPYVLWGCAQTFAAFQAGQIGLPALVFSVAILLTAFMMGLAVCTELERMSRASYRDRRVIEQQQQALVEERANLSRFLSPEVSRMVRERGIEATLVQQTLPLTLVNCDLRGFTAYTKHNGAAQMSAVLHDYYAIVVEVSRRYGGTVSGFAGDGVLIFLGAPIPRADHAQAGLGLGRDLLGAVGALTARFGTPATPLGVGVGVATGVCAVGAIGSQQRLEYMAIGSAVNLSARLCAQATHGQMLMCPATAALVERRPGWREEQVQLKGFDLPVTVTVETAPAPAA